MSSQTHKNQGFVLLASLLILVVLSVLLGAAMARSTSQLKEVHQRRAVQEAFYAAEAGLDRSIYELRLNSGWDPGQAPFPEVQNIPLTVTREGAEKTIGYYSLELEDGGVLNGWNTRWVKAVGTDSLKQLDRVIVARVLVDNPARFLVSTLGDLRIGSGAAIDADILGQDVYFEVNDSLPAPAKNIEINGDVFYLRNILGDLNPSVIFGAESERLKSPSITFAGVDLTRYRTLAENLFAANESFLSEGALSVDLSNLSALKSVPGGPFQPKLIFSAGDIHVTGDYDYSLLLVAGGNIYINGDIMPNTLSGISAKPQIGLFAKKDIIIPSDVQTSGGDLNISGFLIADGSAGTAEGIFKAEGPKFSLGTLNFEGSIAARGRGRSAVDLNTFARRNYTYNPDLNINRTIPFSPFIANILSWKEVSPLDSFPPE